MSDFVTELRREVVTAHAQHRVAAVRTRRRRRRPILAGAVALAALLVAVVWAVRSIPPPEQSTEPRVVKVVRIGGSPGDGVFAYGSLWVTEFEGRRIVRVDPGPPEGDRRVELDEGPDNIDAGAGSLWARGLPTADDPGVADRPGLGRGSSTRSTAPATSGRSRPAPRAAPVADDRHGSIVRISAWRPRRRIAFGVGSGLAAARALGVGRAPGRHGRPHRRSAPRASCTSGRHCPYRRLEARRSLADPRGAWLLSPGEGRILRLEGDRVTRVLRVDDSDERRSWPTGAGLWIVTSDEPRGARLGPHRPAHRAT